MPKISVILTSFNHEKYLREAIDSVLNQTFADFELIIWDDASSDGSWEVINSYSDLRIKVFQNEVTKRGIYGINKAIFEIATGEYIAIHHSDDVWELDKLEKQVACLDNHCEIGAVFTWAQIIDENSAKFENNWFNQENKTRWQWLNQLFHEQNYLNHPSVLIRKQCYQDVGVYRYGLAQTPDAEMWSRVLIRFPIHVIQEKLTKHRLFSDKSNTSGPRIDVAIRISNEWNVLRENYLSITNFEDITAIFPSLERFRNPEGFDSKFLLAMVCLYECKQRSAWQLGLKWLFDLLNDKTRYKKIRELYSFSYMDFIRLTAEFDVYFVEWDKQIAEREQSIAALQAQVQNLLIGKAWLTSQREVWEKTIVEREQSIAALQAQVQNLLIGKAWLTSQREVWEKTIVEREQSIAALQTQVQDLLIGNAWLTSQCKAWEKVAAGHGQSITELTSRLHETEKRLAMSDAILYKLRNHRGMRFVNYLSKVKFFDSLESTMPPLNTVSAAIEVLKATPFAEIQRAGYHFQANDYYSPLNDVAFLKENLDLWKERSSPSSIDWNVDEQLAIAQKVASYVEELRDVPQDHQPGKLEYCWNNPMWNNTDALVQYGLLRDLKPKRVVEVGCGWSSLLMQRALIRNQTPCQVTQIEPYPNPALFELFPKDWQLHRTSLQRAPFEIFESLQAGDICFYDGSHCVKAASDVNWFFFEVLPRLASGVIIHIHDIFLPNDYPDLWIFERGQTWNEQYLLQAFLMNNRDYKILIANAFLFKTNAKALEGFYRGVQPPYGCSFWMQKLR